MTFRVISVLNPTVVLTAGPAISAGTQSQNTGTVSFGNSPTMTFGMNNGTITGSVVAGAAAGLAAGAAGTQIITSGTLAFANSNSISFGMNAGTITASVSHPAQSAYVFNNGNGVSFGTNASTITASVETNYQPPGAYLTTAAQSNHSHGNPTLNLTNLNGTTASNSNGFTLSLSAIVPTQTVQTQNMVSVLGSTGNISFENSNGISFGGNANTITASHNGITTGALSNHSHGISLNLTNISATTNGNSNGISLSLSVANPSADATVFSNSNNVSFGLIGSTITATATWPTQSVQTQNMVSINGSTGNISFNAASSLSSSVNGSSITFGLASNITTALQSAGAYLTTAANSTHSHGAVSLSLGGGLNGTYSSASSGFTLSLTQVAGGGADGYNQAAFTNSTANSTQTIVWAGNSNGSGNVTMGLTGSTVTMSAPSGGGGGVAIQADGSTYTSGTVSFGNANGMSFKTQAGSIVGSYTVPTIPGATVFSNSNNVSFGLNGSTVTATATWPAQTVQPAVAQLNGSSGTMSFAVGSSLSASSNASTITFGLASNITTALQSAGAYLTTARASNDAVGLNTALTGNGVAWTVNSSGISLNVPAFLTTAAQSNHSHGITVNATNINFTTGGNSNGVSLSLSAVVPAQTVQPVAVSGSNGSFAFSTVSFGNSNGVSFYTTNGSMVGSHNALTTARASNDAVGLNTALTANGVAWTVNSSGLSLNVPAFLTTAAQSNHSHGNPTLALTNLSGTTASASNGLTISLSAAAPGGGGGVGLSAGTQSVSTGTVVFANSNGISFGMSGSNQITASYTVPTVPGATVFSNSNNVSFGLNGSTITATATWPAQTAEPRVVSLNGSSNVMSIAVGSSLSASSNASTITFGLASNITTALQSAGAYLTTAALSNHSHGNPTLALTNLSGTTASNSAGLTLSLSAAAGGGGADGYNIVQMGTNGNSLGATWSSQTATIHIQGSGGISVSQNSNTINIWQGAHSDIPEYRYLYGNSMGAASSFTNSPHILNFAGYGDITVGYTTTTGGANIVGISRAIESASYYVPFLPGSTASQTLGPMNVTTASAFFWPVDVQQRIHFQQLNIPFNLSFVTSSVSGRQTISMSYGIYSENAYTLSLISSSSMSFDITNSSVSATINFPSSSNGTGYTYGTVSASTTALLQSQWGTVGVKFLACNFGNTVSLSPGMYYVGFMHRYSSSSAAVGISLAFNGGAIPSVVNKMPFGWNSATATGHIAHKFPYPLGMGVYTSTGSAGYGGTQLPSSVFLTAMAHTMTVLPIVSFNYYR